jgi:hypothetical protein
VYGPVTARLAAEKDDEQLRLARERQRLALHTCQRSRVLESLLLSRRQDAPKHRRTVPSQA